MFVSPVGVVAPGSAPAPSWWGVPTVSVSGCWLVVVSPVLFGGLVFRLLLLLGGSGARFATCGGVWWGRVGSDEFVLSVVGKL